MTEKDARLCQRILEAHEQQNDAIDIMIYGTVAQVRADAVMQERARVARRLRSMARRYLVVGLEEVGQSLAGEADALDDSTLLAES